MSEYFQHYGILSHCAWISVISVFPLIYCGLYFAIKNTITMDQGGTQLVLPDIVRVNSSGPAAELYPDSLGEYRLLPDITLNDYPVFQHSARDDRFIIFIGRVVKWLQRNRLFLFRKFLVHHSRDLRLCSERIQERGNRRKDTFLTSCVEVLSQL